jgi:hypothetical protein
LQREAGVLVVDVKKAELLAQKVLKQHSVRMKVAFSELVVASVESLRSADVKPRERALVLRALRDVCDRLYGWDKEPDIQAMKLARTGSDDVPQGAVNLALIATSPEQLAAMAKAQSDHSGDYSGDYSGDHSSDRNLPSASECNGLPVGPSVGTPQQPLTATHGRPISEKEVPHLPAKQPVQRRWETDLQQAERANRGNPPCPEAPQNALKHSVQQTSVQEPPPTPGSQAWHRLRIEELARLRAEWRGR